MVDQKTIICPHCGKAHQLHGYSSPRRESAIIYLLINPETTTKELAEKLGVSVRQAQYYMKSANEVKDIVAKLYFSILLQDPLRSAEVK